MVTAGNVNDAVKKIWSSFTARPGWVPLLLLASICAANVPADGWLLSDWQPFSWANGWLPFSDWRPVRALVDNPTVAGALLALASYQAGEVFDDLPKVRAWVKKADRSCEVRRDAYEVLGVWHGSYSVALGLLKARKDYAGTLVELYNEGAKFARGAAFLIVILGFMTCPAVIEAMRDVELLSSQPWTVVLVVTVLMVLSWAALILWYREWKSRHKTRLYRMAAEIDEPSSESEGAVRENRGLVLLDTPAWVGGPRRDGPRARLFFWDGELAGTALLSVRERWVQDPTGFHMEVSGCHESKTSSDRSLAAGTPTAGRLTDLLLVLKRGDTAEDVCSLRKGAKLTAKLPREFKSSGKNGPNRVLLLQRTETEEGSSRFVPAPRCFWQDEFHGNAAIVTLTADFPVGVLGSGFAGLRLQLSGLRNPDPGSYTVILEITQSHDSPVFEGSGTVRVRK